MQRLARDIKDRSFRPVYLLYGAEAYLKNSYKNQLVSAIAGDDTMNFNRFEGRNPDVNEIISLAETMPFFSEKRLILVEDSGFFKGSADGLADYLPQMPDTSCLIFAESEVDKRSRLFKQVKEAGYAVEMARQDFGQLSKWAGTLLLREGKKITGHTMELFLDRTGDDMEHIRMELEKLVSFTLGREVITDGDVEAVCSVHVTNKIFDMVTALVNRQTKKAMDLYEDLLTLKEPPMRILFLIARQFNQILQVKELVAKGMDKGAISSRLKVPPFAAGKMIPQARTFTKEQLLGCVMLCVETEEAVKTGQLNDRMAVELLLTRQYDRAGK